VTPGTDVPFASRPPGLSNVAASTAFTEHASAVTLSPSITITETGSTMLASATVSFTGGKFASDGDLLATTTGTSITASYHSTNERLVLTGSDTLAHCQSVLDAVTFSYGENPPNFGSNPIRALTRSVDDGQGGGNPSTAATTNVTITNVNDAPTLSNVAASASHTERAPPRRCRAGSS
jgi:hypothetical protein